MSTRPDRVSLTRHPHPTSPHSPFSRADPTHFQFEPNLHSPPSKQNGTRPRHNYRSATLSGAYRAVSRTSMSDEGAHLGSTPSPRQPWNFVDRLSPISNNSNPPEELVDAYRRIEEDGTLADHVQWDDLDASPEKRSPARPNRVSSRHREYREYEGTSHDGPAFSDTGLFDGITNNSPRRPTADYSRDEQRLRRVTGKDSPVFSKSKTNTRSALTSDNLQRREEEEEEEKLPPRENYNPRYNQEHQSISDHEGDKGPSLNLPPTWGSRSARRQEWLRNVSGGSGSDAPEGTNRQTSSDAPVSKLAPEENRNHTSHSQRDSASAPVRGALEERVANLRTQTSQETTDQPGLGLDQNMLGADGDAIPNTPIVVYKNSSFTKPSASKRDSQELLRRLSRTESPKLGQIQTPEPPKLFERKVYDKTPRVTGAWIDTPMTERVTEIPSDLTKDIVPAAPPKAKEESPSDSQSNTDPKPDDEKRNNNDNNNNAEVKKASTEPIISKQSRSRPALARPKLPKSALETVIEDASSGKEALNMGDDTIESLRAILDDPVEIKDEEDDEAAYAKVLDRLGLARRNSENPDDYDRIDSKLQSLAQHITEVKKGLDRLQDNITNGSGELDTKVDATKTSIPSASSPTSTSSETCKTCSPPPDTRIYAALPLPRLLERSPASQRLRLTKLGWAALVLAVWYVIECLMAETYSRPFWREGCESPCLYPDAPTFPLVTATMLWRWSHLSTFLAPVVTIGVAMFRLVAQLLGLWDGWVDEPAGLQNLTGQILINGTPVAFPWLTPPSKTQQGFSPSSILPPPPPPPEWTPQYGAPATAEDDRASMDDDEYL